MGEYDSEPMSSDTKADHAIPEGATIYFLEAINGFTKIRVNDGEPMWLRAGYDESGDTLTVRLK